MLEIRYQTDQVVRVGVLRGKAGKPVTGSQIAWYYWRYLIKKSGQLIDLNGHTWTNIPFCAGLYYLTLTQSDTDELGDLTLLINDETSLYEPIFMDLRVVPRNVYDSRYGDQLLNVNIGSIAANLENIASGVTSLQEKIPEQIRPNGLSS